MKHTYLTSTAFIIFAVPMLAGAQQSFEGLVGIIINILGALIPLLIALAVVFFLWGVAKYILQSDKPEGRASARQIMIWGIVALFVMVSVWGLVALLQSTFQIQDAQIQFPTLPGAGLQTT